MQGKIIKGIAGFYYVQTEDKLYECKAKGIFRNKKMKPLVGDNDEIFNRFWIAPIAKCLTKLYANSEKSNNV